MTFATLQGRLPPGPRKASSTQPWTTSVARYMASPQFHRALADLWGVTLGNPQQGDTSELTESFSVIRNLSTVNAGSRRLPSD